MAVPFKNSKYVYFEVLIILATKLFLEKKKNHGQCLGGFKKEESPFVHTSCSGYCAHIVVEDRRAILGVALELMCRNTDMSETTNNINHKVHHDTE